MYFQTIISFTKVLKLILLFEDGGTAGDTPDLANRVSVVKMAVDNLVKVIQYVLTICIGWLRDYSSEFRPAF